MLQATNSAAYLASSQASDAAQAPDSNLGGRTLLQATPSDAYATTSGKQGKSAGAPFVSSAPAPSMTMAYQTNQGKQGQGMSATVAPPQQGRHLLQVLAQLLQWSHLLPIDHFTKVCSCIDHSVKEMVLCSLAAE